MPGRSPTSRTLEECRRRGWVTAVAERWNPYGGVRQDLFGFADVVAFDTDRQKVLLLQCCSRSDLTTRINKIVENCAREASAALACGCEIAVWGWAKYKVADADRRHWQVTETVIEMEDLLFDKGNEDEQDDSAAAG